MPRTSASADPRWCIIGDVAPGEFGGLGGFSAVDVFGDGQRGPEQHVPAAEFAEFVRARETLAAPRWVWHDTASRYASLLAQGIRVARCHDLRLSHQILSRSALIADQEYRCTDARWDRPPVVPASPTPAGQVSDTSQATLFDLEDHDSDGGLGPHGQRTPRPPNTNDAPSELAAGTAAEPTAAAGLAAQSARAAPDTRTATTLSATTVLDTSPTAPKPIPVRTPIPLPTPAPAPTTGVPATLADAVAEFEAQRAAIASATDPGRLARLVAAESAGALIAAELSAAGVPWDAAEHDRVLSAALGPRPAAGERPERLLATAAEVRSALDDPGANLDSPPKLLQALRRAGIEAPSTSRWVLEEHGHPAIPPLLAYKRLARLLSANGWAWLDEWVRDGRYRPVYVPGGVVTGRWASSGGGALQLPRQLRSALRADPGWLLVSADVSQLEPRVLSAMAGDRAMAAAGRGKDLYAGIVASGAVASRQEAKIAMLGAMYGGTSGDSGRLVPRLRRTFPAAMALVDDAAAIGERGGIVTTWLGRTSPPPGEEWRDRQAAASLPGATRRDEDRARRSAREWGRFTRNFIVQGTAAEWALVWMADLRRRLAGFAPVPEHDAATASGRVFERLPHLAFFLHDEVIVHTPISHASAVAEAVEAAARTAGTLLFGDAPVDFLLDLRISERAEKD